MIAVSMLQLTVTHCDALSQQRGCGMDSIPTRASSSLTTSESRHPMLTNKHVADLDLDKEAVLICIRTRTYLSYLSTPSAEREAVSAKCCLQAPQSHQKLTEMLGVKDLT